MLALVASLIASAAAQPAPVDLSRRLQESAAAAQALQGPLDGSWTLADAAGRPILVLQLTDPAGGGRLGGAWRKPGGAGGAIGLIDQIDRRGASLTIRLRRGDGGRPSFLRLQPRAPGRWSGWSTEGGRRRGVTLMRTTS